MSAALQNPYAYQRLVGTLDERIASVMSTQVGAPGHPDHGGFVGADGLASPNGVSASAVYGYAYLLPESRYHQAAELVERIDQAADWGRRRRQPSGCFDLLTTNFDSAPDTGFTVQALGPVVRAARLAADRGDAGAERIADSLGELIETAGPGMVRGGFHTPNHRWVLVSALAFVLELFPALADRVRPTVDAYLAETIDINADGEYIERSTAVYNPVCNRALRLAAEILDRPELLEPVRANLELSFHLMHGDATVVTSISSRQDRGDSVVPTGLADAYYSLARQDGNGRFAAIADWLVERGGAVLPWCLEPFLTHPEWRHGGEPERLPPSESYRRYFPVAGLWRVRRQSTSATLAAGLDSPFSLRHGAAELAAVRVGSQYFATGAFVGEQMRPLDGDAGAVLRHAGRNPLYREKSYDRPIYWLPIGDGTRVDAGNWEAVRGRRPTYDLQPMPLALEVREVGDRGDFELRVTSSDGVGGVPFQIEFAFEAGGTVEVDGALLEACAGATMFLKKGHAIYRVGSDEIHIGPGACAHTTWQMRNSPTSDAGHFRLLITLLTPVDHTLLVKTAHSRADQTA